MAGETIGDFGAGTEAGEEHEHTSSSDEYDPSQAVQTEFPPLSAQDSTVQYSPLDPVHNIVPNTSAALMNSSGPTIPSHNDSGVYERQSLSRSMSRASSQSSDSVAITIKSQEQNKGSIQNSEGVEQTETSTGSSLRYVENMSSLDPVSVSTLNVPTNAILSDNVSIQNDVQEQGSLNAAPNGHTNTVPNLAAIIPDTGASSHSDQTAEPSATLPAPPAREAAPVTKSVPSTPITSAPRARLPHDKIGILEDRIKDDSRGDMEAWLQLIDEHKRRAKIDDARSVYERFLTVFPSAAEEWVAYAQMENEAGERHSMDKILSRALPSNPYLPLWSMYLDHIRRHNNLTTDTSGQARQIIHQAYDVALQYTGLDKESGKLWQDYVNFIKSGPGTIGGNNWQDQQKMDLLRKVYQRANCIPHQFTNLLWKEYDGFEMGLNKMTGRKFLQDQSPAYMSARSSYTELQNITRNLRRTTLPVLPPASGFAGDVEYVEQLDIWKRWIQWEKDDPLVLKQDDVAAYRARILFVYKHSLMAMRFWPELWCDASDFCFANDMESDGNDFLTQGIAANPESCLLAFKRADRIELSTTNEEGDDSLIRRGSALREPYDKVLEALYDLIAKCKIRETQEIAQIEANFASATASNPTSNGVKEDDGEGDEVEGDDDKDKQKAAQIESVKNVHAKQTSLLSKTLSHVWIALIRAMRRIQGKGKVNDPVAGLRGTFADARKRGRITSDVYVAGALIEFHCYEVETGKKIFERGLKLFPEDEGFALEYIKHLVANNDHTNARVVFETAVTKLAHRPETVSKAKPLYVFFHDFESRYGELAQIIKLEKRMRDLYPDDPRLANFSRRFVEKDFDPTLSRPIVSPAAQTRPKAIASVESDAPVSDSPRVRIHPNVISPKRPLPSDESDNEGGRPQKLARTTREVSPLKGAAGRRVDQQKRSRLPQDMPQLNNQPVSIPPPPPPLPRDVMFLLSIIPKAETYHATKFSAEALVRLIRETHIPTNISQLPPPPIARGPPAPIPTPAPPPQPMPMAMPMQMPQYQQNLPMQHLQQQQYNGQYNGGYPQSSSAFAAPALQQISTPRPQPQPMRSYGHPMNGLVTAPQQWSSMPGQNPSMDIDAHIAALTSGTPRHV